MSRIPHVIRRRNRYYLRIRNPADVAAILGSDYHVRSLRTHDPRQARTEAAHALVRAHDLWNDIRRGAMRRILGKDIHDIQQEDVERIRDDDILALSPTDRSALIERMMFLRDRMKLDAELAAVTAAKLQYDKDTMYSVAADLERALQQQKLIEMQGSAAVGMAQAELAMRDTIARLSSMPTAAIEVELHPQASLQWNEESLLVRFFADKPNLSESARTSYDQTFREFANFLGSTVALKEIKKASVKEFAEHLRDRPSGRGGTLSRETIKKMLSHLKSYFAWRVEAGHLNQNPAEGVVARAAEADDDEDLPRAFEKNELHQLFHSPLFLGCRSSHRLAEPGKLIVRNERYWFWLVALLTGARTDEIAKAPAQLVKVGNIDCIDFRHATKTKASPRLIPVLPELRRLGFIDWAELQERRGRTLVGGPDAPEDWSKWLNRYLDSVGLDDPSLVAYSLRHNFRQQLRSSGLHHELADKIFGHKSERVGAGYGRHLSADEAQKVVEMLQPAYTLEHL